MQYLATFFVLFFLFTPQPKQAQDLPEAALGNFEQLLHEGDSLVRIKKYDAAASIYEKALSLALDAKNDKDMAEANKKIGVSYYLKKDYSKAEAYYRTSIRINDTSSTAGAAFYNMHLLKQKVNQQDSVLPYLDKSVEVYEHVPQDASVYNAYLGSGTLYKNRQLYDKALQVSLKAFNGFKETKNPEKLAKACILIADIHNRLRNDSLALNYYQEVLQLNANAVPKRERMRAYNGMGFTYASLKKSDSAILNFNRALDLTIPNSPEQGQIFYNLANLYKKTGSLKLARKTYEASIVIEQKANDTIALVYSYNGLADLLLMENSSGKAKTILDLVEDFAAKIPDAIVLLDHLDNKVAYSRQIGDYKAASDLQKRYSELFETIYDLKQTEMVQTLQSRFDYEKKENENLQLSLMNKNNLLLLEEQRSKIQEKNWLLTILIFVVILLLFSYYVYLQKQKATSQALKIEKLQAIHQGQETIKKSIARDLHDIITTNFDGLRLKILSLPRAKNIAALTKEVTADIKTINEHVRMVSHRLSPLEMQVRNRPFSEILKSQLSEFQLYRNITVQLDNGLPSVLDELGLEVQNHLYSIIMETLNNVAKHSRATELDIDCHVVQDSHLHLTMRDNGIGIPTDFKKGIGLMNIEQRVEILEGISAIKKSDTGTEVFVSFPLKEKRK